jgi:hypothetical protein
VPAFFEGPHAYLLLSAIAATVGSVLSSARARLLCALVTSGLGGVFLFRLAGLEGFYAYSFYYGNRSFLVLALAAFVCLLFLVWWRWPATLSENRRVSALPLVLIPMVFAVAGDLLGTYRWNHYVGAFCRVLGGKESPERRLERLKASGALTAWGWTHPTMSVLLRDRGSQAMVVNEANAFSWQPFSPSNPLEITSLGLCQAPLLGPRRPDSFELPLSFQSGPRPSYIARVIGVSHPEGWATWSDGEKVEIHFVRPLPRSFDLVVTTATAFGANRELPVTVRVGGQTNTFVPGDQPQSFTLRFREVDTASVVTFDIPRPQSPSQLGLGDDSRRLGIALTSVQVIEV